MPLDFQTSIANDFEVFDGVQTITLTKTDDSGTSTVEKVSSFTLSKKQAALLAGMGIEDETRGFSIPAANVAAGYEPVNGMEFADAAGQQWRIVTVEMKTMGSRFLVAAVKTREAYIMPVLAGGGSTTTWDKAYDGTAIAADLDVSQDAGDEIESATVWISSGGLSGDRIIKSVADGSSWTENGIIWTWTAETFTLAGVGAASAAEYQSQLRALKYDYNGGWGNLTPGNRVISFKVNDGANDSNTVTQTVSVSYFTGSLGSWTWKGVTVGGTVPSGQMYYDGGTSPFTSPINLAASNQLKRLSAIQDGATIQFGGGINGTVSLIQDNMPLNVSIDFSNAPNVGSLVVNSTVTLTVVAP